MDALSNLVVDANDVLELKLVRNPEDIEDDSTSFGPNMCHQVFGDSENIFGYTDLHIRLFYSAASLQTYLGIFYTEKVDPTQFDGVKADDVVGKISQVIPPKYMTNIDDFIKNLPKDNAFVPYGNLIHSFSITQSGIERTFEVYFCETDTPNFISFHTRLQTFLLWYVDAASFIDVDDDQWTFFVMYERYKGSDGNVRRAVVGISTVYRYYAYPVHTRPRISQALILPPFQRLGLGAQLLHAIYTHFIPMSTVVDITVEDPSEEFQRIRDYVDIQNCENLPAYDPEYLSKGNLAKRLCAGGSQNERITAKFTKEMANQARSKLKINSRQARRVYEILRFKHTDKNDPKAYQLYRLDVKNRLNAPFQKKKNELKKLEKVLKAEEYAAALSITGQEESYQRLNSQYSALETSYKKVLARIES